MNLGAEQTWMVLCDTSGNKILDKTFFTTGHDEYGQVISDFQGCYTSINYTISDTGGYRTFNNNGGGDIWISKVCPFSVGVEEKESSKNYLTANYNATSGMLEVVAIGPISTNSTFQIFNVNGQLMEEEKTISIKSPFKINFNVEGLSSGVYLLRWITKNDFLSVKFIKN